LRRNNQDSIVVTIVDYVERSARLLPDKWALIHGDEQITYSALCQRMREKKPLPVPLLGESWDGDFLLRTTGTTGQSKTVVLSQEAVIANSENLIDRQGYSRQTVFITTGALDHLGNWSKVFPVWMMGGTVIVLDSMKYIDGFYEALDRGVALSGTNPKLATFLVPANIRILLQFSADRLATYRDKIDFIETGAAPISHADMLHLCALLPNTRLYNTYASTETGVVASYNFNDGSTMASCCGKPMKNTRLFISPEGRIVCQGSTLMSGYLDAPELTRQVLKRDDQGVPTFYTSDNGYLDHEGLLHIQGRTDDIINVGGLKVAPAEVEEVTLGVPGITDCICVATPHPILGQALKLLVVSEETLNKRELAQYIAQRVEKYKVPLYYERVDHVERNANGKINRKYYRELKDKL
jgi:long-chain acyl-CoA synthetase